MEGIVPLTLAPKSLRYLFHFPVSSVLIQTPRHLSGLYTGFLESPYSLQPSLYSVPNATNKELNCELVRSLAPTNGVQCPLHGAQSPSLFTLLPCMGSCHTSAIVSALTLDLLLPSEHICSLRPQDPCTQTPLLPCPWSPSPWLSGCLADGSAFMAQLYPPLLQRPPTCKEDQGAFVLGTTVLQLKVYCMSMPWLQLCLPGACCGVHSV